MSEWLARGGKSSVDAIAFHNYPINATGPEQVVAQVALEQSAMAASGVGQLPLWDTESGWGEDTSMLDSGDQVAFLARHLILQMSSGVQKSYWYAYDNTGLGSLWWSATVPGPNGLVGLSPAGAAYNTLSTWLDSASFTVPCAATKSDSTTWSCMIKLKGSIQAELVWNTTSSKSFVATGYRQYRTLDGSSQAISNGTVTLSTSPLLLVP